MEIEFTKQLRQRHLFETAFHNQKSQKHPKDNFYNHGAAWHAFEKMLKMAGVLEDKKVLDLGCGTGWASVIYANKGAVVTGLDISDSVLKIAEENAMQRGLKDKIRFMKGYAENLPFDQEFDLILGTGILHHTDVQLISTSISKALKTPGKALFIEPLNHNLLIKLFRILTPWRRSSYERPLEVKDLESFRKTFREVNYSGYNLISLLAFIFVPMKAYGMFYRCNQVLSKLDKFLFNLIPSIQRYCWGAIIELEK